jgi:uncharacterized membrane protein YedE/YeeE
VDAASGLASGNSVRGVARRVRGLLLWYWFALRLGTMLLYAALLVLVAALTGKRAPVAMSERRAGVPAAKISAVRRVYVCAMLRNVNGATFAGHA